jgi:hydroxyacyl-ACP dehydratase HTD2-like protein with hotdog domain
MTPTLELPPHLFGVYGGHDIEFHAPIRAGEQYHLSGRISEVYEKIGRSGVLTVVVREATIHDAAGRLAARIVERQIIRQRPAVSGPPTAGAEGETL